MSSLGYQPRVNTRAAKKLERPKPLTIPTSAIASTNERRMHQYAFNVKVGSCVLNITGSNRYIVRQAKFILDEYFGGQSLDHPDRYGEEYASTPAFGLYMNSSTYERGFPSTPTLGSYRSSSNNEEECLSTSAFEMYENSSNYTEEYLSTSALGTDKNSSSSSLEIVVESAPQEETIEAEPAVLKQYDLQELLSLATTPLAHSTPVEWQYISKAFPIIVKKT